MVSFSCAASVDLPGDLTTSPALPTPHAGPGRRCQVEGMLFTHPTNWAGQGIDLTFSLRLGDRARPGIAATVHHRDPRSALYLRTLRKHAQGTFIDGARHLHERQRRSPHRPLREASTALGCACDLRPGAPDNHISGYGSTVMNGAPAFGQQSPFDVEGQADDQQGYPDTLVISRSTRGRGPSSPRARCCCAPFPLTYTFRNEGRETIRSHVRARGSVHRDDTRARHARSRTPRRAATRGSNGYAPGRRRAAGRLLRWRSGLVWPVAV